MRDDDDNMTGVQVIAFLVFLAICFSVDIAWNAHVYGDWTCAFAKCVKVKP